MNFNLATGLRFNDISEKDFYSDVHSTVYCVIRDCLNKGQKPDKVLLADKIKNLGISFKDDINIYGNPKLQLSNSFEIKNYLKDHRIFFLSTIAALTLGGKWKIHDKDSINTSFPNFLNMLKKIGAKIN